MEYSPDLKNNHATRYLAEEFERLEHERISSREAAGEDALLLEMAEEDDARIKGRQAEILEDIERILAREKEEESKPKAVVLEFRAAAGGDEASLFATELRDMYMKYAEGKNWKMRRVDDMTVEIDNPAA